MFHRRSMENLRQLLEHSVMCESLCEKGTAMLGQVEHLQQHNHQILSIEW